MPNCKGSRVTGPGPLEVGIKVICCIDGIMINGDDDVSDAQSGGLCGGTVINAGDKDSFAWP